MDKISFVKMTGAGNDFIVIDKDANTDLVLSQDDIKKLCNRRYGIGADGIILISTGGNFNFNMEYFNADGSTGSLCGNGARCAIKFAFDKGFLQSEKARFLSNGIEYSGFVTDAGQIQFNLNQPSKIKLNFKVKAAGQLITASYAETGSPHVVIKTDDLLKDVKDLRSSYKDINEVPVFSIGREIRSLPEFAPGGVNVNFIELKNDKLIIRTYERGVEDETFACGTGAAAAAIVSHLNYDFSPPVLLITKGGNELKVDFKYMQGSFSDVSLTGPADFVYTGEFFINK